MRKSAKQGWEVHAAPVEGWVIYGIYVDDALQYIGLTANLAKRTYKHAHSRFPGQKAIVKVLETAPTLAKASRREKALIKRHKPPMNERGNPVRRRILCRVETTRRGAGDTTFKTTILIREGMMLPDEARTVWFEGKGSPPARAKRMGWSLGYHMETGVLIGVRIPAVGISKRS